jgi:hypothetical protein
MVRKATSLAYLVCVVLILAPNFASANSKVQEINSLADLAREQHLKNKEDKQPPRLYTNDDLPTHSADAPSTPFIAITLAADTKNQGDSNSQTSGSEPHDEKYFRNGMNQLRANFEFDNQALASLQQKMDEHMGDFPNSTAPTTRQISMGWATDPIRTYNFWLSEDTRLRSRIDSMQEKIAADQQDISDFVDQCRHEDCKPGWIR